MPDVTLSTDIDAFLKTADDAAARTELGLGSAAEAATGDFATAAEGILAGTALQPADPTLESVTTNGATTLNNIEVGTITTLHPTNPANNNSATGNQSCAIGGILNQVSGNRSVSYGGRENQVSGNDSSTIGGFGQIVIGQEAEGLGSTDTTLHTKYTSAIGTINSVVGLAGEGATSTSAAHSAVLGGNTNIIESATEAVIVGGTTNTIQSTHHRSVILGGQNITTDAADTAYVPNLNVGAGFKMPTGATDTYVLTTDANGVGTWQAAGGGGGGSSVVASFVDNSFEVNKPSSADVVVPVTQMAYEMQAGTTYYVKMFIALGSGTYFSGGNYTLTPLILSHTPWAATAGVKKGFIGTNWLDTGVGSSNQIYSSRDITYVAAGYDASASSVYLISPQGFGGYGGWAKVEGMITAPSTATFTPTLSIVGGGGPTGSLTVSFQGMIMEMP